MTQQQTSLNPLAPLIKTFKDQADKAKDASRVFEFATVTDVSSDGALIQFDRDTDPSDKRYRWLGRSGIRVGDRVLCVKVFKRWVILGALNADASEDFNGSYDNPQMILPYNASFSIQSYAIRKSGNRVDYNITVKTTYAISAGTNFVIVAVTDPSLTAAYADQLQGWINTGYGAVALGFFQTGSGVFIATWFGVAIAAGGTFTMTGSYTCSDV